MTQTKGSVANDLDWTGRPLAVGGVAFGDVNCSIGLSSGDADPVYAFDPNDYLVYDRSANTLAIFIGATAYFTFAAAGLTANTHLLFSTDSTFDIGTTSVRPRVAYVDDIELRPGASRTPAANGDLSIEATNNTTITLKLKGSDGTVRSGTVTLS